MNETRTGTTSTGDNREFMRFRGLTRTLAGRASRPAVLTLIGLLTAGCPPEIDQVQVRKRFGGPIDNTLLEATLRSTPGIEDVTPVPQGKRYVLFRGEYDPPEEYQFVLPGPGAAGWTYHYEQWGLPGLQLSAGWPHNTSTRQQRQSAMRTLEQVLTHIKKSIEPQHGEPQHGG